ncbi:hypothetical protein [Streptomyces chartreusis]|uniref:hypothetical protein n=1 Tax=Streptomyces chartreusis TaxID=1969 RepID=UPI0036749952
MALVKGRIEIDGDEGVVAYRWERNDGVVGETIREEIRRSEQVITPILRWKFNGHGTFHALAQLRILKPGGRVAQAKFNYVCR